jgi:hypothetical protein
MAKNMFYNYDAYSDKVKFTKCCKPCLKEDLCDRQEAEYLYNIKGDFMGIKAKVNSSFKLYFNFTSDDKEGLTNILDNYEIMLDILDYKYDVVLTLNTIVAEDIDECEVLVDLAADNKFKEGIYKLYLYYLENGVKKSLYSNFNTLSIE